MRLDRQFTLAIKAVVQSQTTVTALGGDLDFVPFAVEESKSLALAEITKEKVLDTLEQQVTLVGKDLLRRIPELPEATASWLDQYLKGKLVVHVDTQDVTEHIDSLGATFTKLTAGLIVTGMIIGTAIVTTQIWQSSADQMFLPYVAMVIFVITLLVGSLLAWRMLHPPQRLYRE